MKKFFAICLAVLMTAALAGCGSTNASSSAGSSAPESSAAEPSSTPESSAPESSETESSSEAASDGAAAAGTGLADGKTMADFVASVKSDVFPDMNTAPIDDAMLQDLYHVDMANVESYVGEMSMMNVQAFDILVIQAKEGKVEDVKAALEQRKEDRIGEFEFYPVNGNDLHTQNALVLTSGDYAILVICSDYEGVQPVIDAHFTDAK